MPDQIARINVIDFRGPNKSFYAYANSSDNHYLPDARILSVGNSAYLLLSSDFKLKKIEKKWRNRIDVYMSMKEAAKLGRIIKEAIGASTPTPTNADPNANKQGDMELPDIDGTKYQTGIYSLFADVAGKHYSYLDETGSTGIFIEREIPKPEHKVMDEREIHFGCTLQFAKAGDLKFIHAHSAGSTYIKNLKNPDDGSYGKATFGSAAGLIVITMVKSQMMQLGGALLQLTK